MSVVHDEVGERRGSKVSQEHGSGPYVAYWLWRLEAALWN